ncbi:hypothetical protein GGR51DRAFT_530718 [Nemania sp. FL0031]|nr:hypothetical protein GGR51DRAFT_530718 [Nemania sp. FL0031]
MYKMAPQDEGGAVDLKLNVYGVHGLKVVDLSIPPLHIGAKYKPYGYNRWLEGTDIDIDIDELRLRHVTPNLLRNLAIKGMHLVTRILSIKSLLQFYY